MFLLYILLLSEQLTVVYVQNMNFVVEDYQWLLISL
jgi:hypothetical protein